jgi:hypothetical protein
VLAVAGLAAASSAIAGIEGIAVALSLVTSCGALMQMRWAFGAQWRGGVAGMLSATGREIVVLGTAFAPSAVLLLAFGDTLLSYLSAAVLAGVLVAVISRIAWPREWQAFVGLIRRSSRLVTAQPGDPVAGPASEEEPTSVLRA